MHCVVYLLVQFLHVLLTIKKYHQLSQLVQLIRLIVVNHSVTYLEFMVQVKIFKKIFNLIFIINNNFKAILVQVIHFMMVLLQDLFLMLPILLVVAFQLYKLQLALQLSLVLMVYICFKYALNLI